MDRDAAIEAKDKLRAAIAEALAMFTEDTGLVVDEIYVIPPSIAIVGTSNRRLLALGYQLKMRVVL